MTERSTDKSYTRGYSLPDSMHRLIEREAKRRGMGKSMLVNQALRFFFREHSIPISLPALETTEKAS